MRKCVGEESLSVIDCGWGTTEKGVDNENEDSPNPVAKLSITFDCCQDVSKFVKL